MGHAERLDGGNAAGWLHVVVKREAQTIRRSRSALGGVRTRSISTRTRRARCRRPTSGWRRSISSAARRRRCSASSRRSCARCGCSAQGHSYNEISALTGWSYTKVNRCLTEGRRSFLSRYATIESGAECERWLPVISAMVDGEATSEQLVDLRPHLRNCPGCRATLKTLQDSAEPLAAVLPIPLAAVWAARTS